jgi:hypothetical protein
MTTRHKMISWTAGDDWEIDAILLHEDGTPYDLTGPHTVKWALLSPAGARVLDETDVNITTVDALSGAVSIKIAASLSSPLTAGIYSDTLRIVYAGITSTLSTGAISVHADPWLGAHAMAADKTPPKLELVKSGGIIGKKFSSARVS